MSDGAYQERRSLSERFLPPDPRVREPYRLTPPLALRVGILGAVALLLFALLFLRLWSLQVLSGDEYLNAAQNNQLRLVRLEAPRGPILDRNGRTIVSNVAGTAVELWVGDMPRDGRYALLRRLGAVLDVSPLQLAKEVEKRRDDPLTPIVVKTSVPEKKVHYLYEHRSEFPGVKIVGTYLRHYPYDMLAAQILGYVGEISEEELKALRREGYRLGDSLGKTGVEASFDTYLRGKAGLLQLRVDSLGNQVDDSVLRQEQRSGYALRLTLDMKLQKAAEDALEYGVNLAHQNDHWAANGGAIVALDPRDGAVLALASSPTYKPSVFVGRGNPREARAPARRGGRARCELPRPEPRVRGPLSARIDVEAGHRARRNAGARLLGVRLDPVLAVRRVRARRQRFVNWNPFVDRPMTLPEALAESCDTYFYEIGDRLLPARAPRGGSRMQQWAREFGFGSPTGLDIGGEADGLVPTPDWRWKTFESDWDRAWNPGDSIQLAIGQKDLLVTPLQMAAFYAMLANGGNVVTPYLVSDVEQPRAKGSPRVVLRRFAPRAPKASGVDPGALAAVRDGLYLATHSAAGTSSGVFGNYPVQISGKTGTAEKVVPLPGYPATISRTSRGGAAGGRPTRPSIVVCALIENGGHGSTAAAPAALKVFEQFFGQKAPPAILSETD